MSEKDEALQHLAKEREHLNQQIRDLLAHHKTTIIFQTSTMIYFREIEDLITYLLTRPYRYRVFHIPAWRYYCREDRNKNQNRIYYLIDVGYSLDEHLKLVTGDATDYSGHGGGDMELAEYFITQVLKLPIEERPLSYLFSELENELNKLTMKETTK